MNEEERQKRLQERMETERNFKRGFADGLRSLRREYLVTTVALEQVATDRQTTTVLAGAERQLDAVGDDVRSFTESRDYRRGFREALRLYRRRRSMGTTGAQMLGWIAEHEPDPNPSAKLISF